MGGVVPISPPHILYRRKAMPRIARIPTCHPDRKHSALGYCRSCYVKTFLKEYLAAYNKKWQEDNKEYVREQRKLNLGNRKGKRQRENTTVRLRNYKLTLNSYAKLVFEQNGLCKACKRLPDRRGFHIDHDHQCCPRVKTCGKCIRGLLCGKCNSSLGYAGDSVGTLLRLADYLILYQKPLTDLPAHYTEFYGS
jgi:Recombination endonuclease VII